MLATQCLVQKKAKTLLIRAEGTLPTGVTAKDLVLAVIGKIGIAGGTGSVIEFGGSAFRALSMEGRMTVSNMSIEAGARAGMFACDETTIDYLRGRPYAPQGEMFDKAAAYWRTLVSDPGAKFDRTVDIDVASLKPQVTWGTSPEMVVSIEDRVPDPDKEKDPTRREAIERALVYMGLDAQHADDRHRASTRSSSARAPTRASRTCAPRPPWCAASAWRSNVKLALVVPGSGLVKAQAEKEGLDRIFRDSGFEWREPGCSMCLAMNDDKLEPGERCASTSNRNFEGRQGAGGRTHLVSPEMAAAAAIAGHFVDVRRVATRRPSSSPRRWPSSGGCRHMRDACTRPRSSAPSPSADSARHAKIAAIRAD